MNSRTDSQKESRGLRRSRRTRKGEVPITVDNSGSSTETESDFTEASSDIGGSDIAQFGSDSSEECSVGRRRKMSTREVESKDSGLGQGAKSGFSEVTYEDDP